nr:zinc finger, CCHC-type [Tanacetum cinerariifolium]
MQIILEANGLWEMTKPNEKTKADNKKDKNDIAFLYQALPEDQLLQITKHKTTKAIWDALKTRYIGEERVKQARLQTLKSEFEMLQMKEDETIDTFTTKLTTLVNKAASLGHTMEDETLVHKLLNVVPDNAIFFSSGISLPQQGELFFIAVGMNSGSGNSSLAVEISSAFYSQQSSPKLDAPSAIKFPESNAIWRGCLQSFLCLVLLAILNHKVSIQLDHASKLECVSIAGLQHQAQTTFSAPPIAPSPYHWWLV